MSIEQTTIGTADPRFEQRQKRVQEAIEERIAHAKSQKAFAKTIGRSDSTIIDVRAGNWHRISETMLRQLEAALHISSWPILETRNQIAINQLCQDALESRRMVAIAAPTGYGKTSALRRFAALSGAAYVLCTMAMKQGTFLSAIVKGMGLTGGNSLDERLDAIARHLRSAEVPLLILDDVGKLPNQCFGMIQLINDLTEGAAGIVLAGTEHFKKVIETGVQCDYKSFRELNGRISYWQPLSCPTPSEIRGFANEHSITDGPAKRWLEEHTTDFRSLRNYIENATRKAAATGEPITRELLNDLHVGDFAYRRNSR